MLKHKVVTLVFLPWLSQYTAHVIRAAKEEERLAIVAELSRLRTRRKGKSALPYRAALTDAAEMILSRSE